MDWKKALVNLVTGLTIAIVGGVVVWFLTRPPERSDGVQYTVSQPAVFGGGAQLYTFFSVDVRNVGNAPATGVIVRVLDDNGGTLRDFRIARSKSRPEVNLDRRSSGVTTFTPRLLPSEHIVLSTLFTTGRPVSPVVIVKTDTGIAKQSLPNDAADRPSFGKLGLYLSFLTFALFALSIRQVIKRIAGALRNPFSIKSRNNAAFLLLHSNVPGDAHDILTDALKHGECGPIELSNLAAANVILKRPDAAQSLIATATSWAETVHDKSVVLFNKAIIAAVTSDLETAAVDLKSAISLNPSIRDYAQKSQLCAQVFAPHPAIFQLYEPDASVPASSDSPT